jgi:hypothetical protein
MATPDKQHSHIYGGREYTHTHGDTAKHQHTDAESAGYIDPARATNFWYINTAGQRRAYPVTPDDLPARQP